MGGSLTNDLRNLSRAAKMVLPREAHIMYSKFIMLFPYVLMFHLQRRPVDIQLVKDILLQEYEPLKDIDYLPALRTNKLEFGSEREKFRYNYCSTNGWNKVGEDSSNVEDDGGEEGKTNSNNVEQQDKPSKNGNGNGKGKVQPGQ